MSNYQNQRALVDQKDRQTSTLVGEVMDLMRKKNQNLLQKIYFCHLKINKLLEMTIKSVHKKQALIYKVKFICKKVNRLSKLRR